jgi:hypothetical protein
MKRRTVFMNAIRRWVAFSVLTGTVTAVSASAATARSVPAPPALAPALPSPSGMLGDLYEIPKTSVAPVIDGVMDPVWRNVGEVFQRSYTNGTQPPDDFSDLMGWSRLMYDDNNLYVLLYTQDDIIQDVHANTYERDSWEIYFDGDNSKGTAYDGVNDLQIRLGHGVTDVANLEGQTYWVRDGVEYAVLDNPAGAPSGWMTEVKLPLAGIFVEPVANSIIGFELQQNDNDAEGRESISKWWVAEGDPSWNNASTFGEAILTDRPIDGRLEVAYASRPPVIDGVRDDVWELAAPFQANSFDNGPEVPDNYGDCYFQGELLADDCYLYGIVWVWDDIIQDEHPNTYEQDGLEFFIDGDHSRGSSIDSKNDMELRFNHHYTDISQVIGPSYFNRDYSELAVRDTDLGWTLEFKLALPGIFVKPETGREFGLEVQLNDNDGTRRNHIAKWWLDDGDATWHNPSLWGTAYISDRTWNCCGKSSDGSCPWENGIEAGNSPALRRFGIESNFPNPFNPKTTVAFFLPSAERARLSFYDTVGNEVAVTVDGFLAAGRHETVFDGTGLASGVYFCKLRTADRMDVMKITLVK